MKLIVTDEIPIFQRPRETSHEYKHFENDIRERLADDIIQHSKSVSKQYGTIY